MISPETLFNFQYKWMTLLFYIVQNLSHINYSLPCNLLKYYKAVNLSSQSKFYTKTIFFELFLTLNFFPVSILIKIYYLHVVNKRSYVEYSIWLKYYSWMTTCTLSVVHSIIIHAVCGPSINVHVSKCENSQIIKWRLAM